MTVAFELSASIHDEGCDCREKKSSRAFEAAVRRQHPLAWQWATEWKGLVTDDTTYVDVRNQIGGNPRQQPNPDGVPKSLQRKPPLTKAERLEDLRHKRRWRFADQRIYDDEDPSLLMSYAHGWPLSLSQAAMYTVIADGWIRCSRPSLDANGNEREGVWHETHPDYATEVNGERVCDDCRSREI